MGTRIFCLWLWLLFTNVVGCGPEFIDQHDRIRIITDSNVHSGPGPQFKVKATIKGGSNLFLLESENDWHRVQLPDGRTGWIFKGVTKTIAPEKVIVLMDTKIRRGPGEEYKVFAIAKQGKTLEARGDHNNWYLVDLPDGKSGWISKKEADKVNYRNITATEKNDLYQSPGSNSQVLLNTDQGADLAPLNQREEDSMVQLPGDEVDRLHEDQVNTVKQGTLVVKERAYIRYGPSIQWDIMQAVEKGTRLIQLGKKDSWYEVQTPEGKTGWIYQDFVKTTGIESQIAVEEEPVYVIANTDANIRQGYGTNWQQIARVKKGTMLVKIGQRDDWLRIKMPDQRIGWIQEDLVTYDQKVLITLDKCNIRLGPSTDYRIKTTVARGTPLVKISEESGWSRVSLPDGELGWIRNDLRADTETALFAREDCNVREGPGTEYRQIDRIKMGTPVVQLGKQDNWYKVQLPSKKEGWIRGDLLLDRPNQMITKDRVNIRLGPSTAYRVLAEVEKNTPLILLGEEEDWYRVKLPDGRIGWIRKDLVSYSYYPMTSENQPAEGPATRSSPTSEQGVKMVTTAAVNLRVGPDINEAKITQLPAGTQVRRINQQGEWYEVQTTDGILGFVHQSGFANGSSKIITSTKSNVRFGPGQDFKIIAVLPEKSELTKIEQRDDWIYVRMSNNQKGWIHKDLVDQSKVPAPLLPRKIDAVSGNLLTTEDCKILKGPDESYSTIKSVKMNTELKMISKYKDWYEVETLTGDKGWVADKFVQEKENKKIIVARKTEVHQEPDTQSNLIAIANVGDYYAPLNQEGGWYRIPIKPGVTGWIASQDMLDLKYPAVYVNTGSINVLRFADEKSTRVAVIKEGVELAPIDETEDWLFVLLPRGDKGWVQKKLVNRQKYPRIEIVKDTEAYEQPNAGSQLKATLTKGDKFLVLDKNKNWYKIFLRGAEVGWVYGGYLKEIVTGSLLIKDASFLRMGPGLEYRIITTLSGGEQVKQLDEEKSWYQVQTATGEVGWIKYDLTKDITLPEMTAQRSSSVYAGPGTNFARVGEISEGNKFLPVKKEGNWYQLRLRGGTEGWVPTEVFTAKKPKLVFTLDKANVRNGPGLHFAVIQTIEPAVDVTVIGSEGNWYYIQLQDGTRGYIQKDLLFEE